MGLSNHRLRCLYRSYNRRWFGGELPEKVAVYYSAADGFCADVIDGEEHAFVIRINVSYAVDMNMVRMSLLHEMVHIKLWPNRTHGGAFQREMQSLAAAGAFKGLW